MDAEVAAFFRDFDHVLGGLAERISNMATAEQISKLTADIQALTAAIDAFKTAVEAQLAKAGTPQPDPAVDTLSQTVEAKTAELTAATPQS